MLAAKGVKRIKKFAFSTFTRKRNQHVMKLVTYIPGVVGFIVNEQGARPSWMKRDVAGHKLQRVRREISAVVFRAEYHPVLQVREHGLRKHQKKKTRGALAKSEHPR